MMLGAGRLFHYRIVMTLGLSRTSAIYIAGNIEDGNLGPGDCRSWIDAADLTQLDIPEVVRREVLTKRRPER